MENNNDTHRIKRSSSAWLGEMREFLRGRFSLDEDKAQRDEVVASISKGVVFRGVNLWVLIFGDDDRVAGPECQFGRRDYRRHAHLAHHGADHGHRPLAGYQRFRTAQKVAAQLCADVRRGDRHLDSLFPGVAPVVEQQRVAGTYRADDLRRADRIVRRPGWYRGADAAGSHFDRDPGRGDRYGADPAPLVPRASALPRGRYGFSSGRSTSFSSTRYSSPWRPMPWCGS